MFRIGMFSVIFVTAYLFLYTILLQFKSTETIALGMLMFAPALVAWMVYAVLRFEKYTGRSLGEDEFGYQDKEI